MDKKDFIENAIIQVCSKNPKRSRKEYFVKEKENKR